MSELIRFDVESHDGKPAICIEAGKGYWTPWYIAQRRINELRSSRDEYRSNHERLVEALREAVETIEDQYDSLWSVAGYGKKPPCKDSIKARALLDEISKGESNES